jgi:hypothetical protein
MISSVYIYDKPNALSKYIIACPHYADANVNCMDARLHCMNARLHCMNAHLHCMDARLHCMNAHLHCMDARLHCMNARLHCIDARLHCMNARLHCIDARMHCMNARLHCMNARLHCMELHFCSFEHLPFANGWSLFSGKGQPASCNILPAISNTPGGYDLCARSWLTGFYYSFFTLIHGMFNPQN